MDNREVMNSVINNLLAECGKQNMYDESKNIIEARNIIEEVYEKILKKYESKNEQKHCDKCECVEAIEIAEKVRKEREEKEKKKEDSK